MATTTIPTITNFQLFIFDEEEQAVVFCPLLPTVCGKGPNAAEALEMWQMRAHEMGGYNLNLSLDDLNTSRKVWYGQSEEYGGVYIVDDERTDRGVAFCPRTGRAESFRWTKFRSHVRNGSASPLSFPLVSGLFDHRVRCSLSHPIFPQNSRQQQQHHHRHRHSLTPHHMS